jgi:4-amino-4-deoxy-L-arabinose transferase-like glycosyltransferase
MRSATLRIVAGFIIAVVFLGQGITTPFQNDEETRPAGIVLDIVNHDDWLIPVDLHGELTRKPPLFYWTTAAIAEARGRIVDEPGARVVSLIAAAATAALVIELASEHFGITAGWLAYLFLLGTYGFASRAGLARTDMLFTFLLFAAYCTFYPLASGAESTLRTIVVGALLGMAILTKGPLAFVLFFGGIGAYYALVGSNPFKLLLNRQISIILGIALVVAAAWYIPAFVRNPKLLQVQLVEENLGHFLPVRFGGTGEAARPIYYILLRFIGATLPLNFYLLAVAPSLLHERNSRGIMRYQLGLLVATLGVFTVSSAKRDDYILTALPSYAMLIAAPFADDTATDPVSARLADTASCGAALSLLTLTLGGLAVCRYAGLLHPISAKLHPSDAAYVSFFLAAVEAYPVRIELTLLLVVVASALAFRLVWRRRGAAATLCIALADLAAVSLWLGLLMPEFARQHTLKAFALEARTIVDSRDVMIAGGRNYEVSYYLGRGVPAWPHHLVAGSRPPNRAYLFVWSQQLDQFRANEHNFQGSVVLASHAISNRGRMLLLSLDPGAPIGTPQ